MIIISVSYGREIEKWSCSKKGILRSSIFSHPKQEIAVNYIKML